MSGTREREEGLRGPAQAAVLAGRYFGTPCPTRWKRLGAALTDRYAIQRQIGAGGMATVYLARDLKHDRNVALKVLRPSWPPYSESSAS